MSKKRPSGRHRSARAQVAFAVAKSAPAYWRSRVFKNSYTADGKLRHTRNWCVKVQHLGIRRTLTLLAAERTQAAAEACQLYGTLRKEGWARLLNQSRQGNRWPARSLPSVATLSRDQMRPAYWAQQLVRREYTMFPRNNSNRELSARLEHQGVCHYFPLGTSARNEASLLALQIYRTVTRHGWEPANQKFARELTVAFRWLEGPLAWTYTTIHTQVPAAAESAPPLSDARSQRCPVAVIESDVGIQRALCWCINRMEHFACAATFASAAEALRVLRRHPLRLALVSSQLTDKPGPFCLQELKDAAPSMAGVLFSAYTDSEELFRSTPGGATNYMLQRTPSTRFLDPLAGLPDGGSISERQITACIWQYFKNIFTSPPAGRPGPPVLSLTQREHEVLARLSQGSPDKDIAERLGISIHTVHEHVRNIYEKLGVHNRTEAVVKFLQK